MIDSANNAPRMIGSAANNGTSNPDLNHHRIQSSSLVQAAAAAAAAAAAQASSNSPEGSTLTPQKTPGFAIQELLGLTASGAAEQVKSNPNNVGSAGGASGLGSSGHMGAGSNFPPISCYNSSFFNSSAVDQYSQHQRMYFNSAGLFGNLHHQSQSFASSSAAAHQAASHLLDSTLRSDHTLSSKHILNLLLNDHFIFFTTQHPRNLLVLRILP
mgnify:CR=1 FL=1